MTDASDRQPVSTSISRPSPSGERVVVVGCGVVGAAIAYELSREPGLSVTVVDRRSGPTMPARPPAPSDPSAARQPQGRPACTDAALGVLMGIISQKTRGRAWNLRQESMTRYRTLLPELEALTGLAIPRNPCGILKLCYESDAPGLLRQGKSRGKSPRQSPRQSPGKSSPANDASADRPTDPEGNREQIRQAIREQWATLAALRRSQGWRLDWLDRDAVCQRYPQANATDILGAVHSPEDFQIDPTALTQALVAGAERQGAQFRWGETVTGLDRDAAGDRAASPAEARVTAVATSAGSIACDWVAIAAGLGSAPLAVATPAPAILRPVLGQAQRVRLPRPLGDREPVITGRDAHVVPLGGGDYWLGATVEFPEGSEPPTPDPERLRAAIAKAVALCPALAEAEVLETWYGLRPRPEGRAAPAIARLSGCANAILASGHYRNGVLLAPATALAIRGAIVAGAELP